MSRHDRDDELRDALRDLPVMTAPPGFTDGVMRRLETGDAAARGGNGRLGSPRLALAAMVVAALCGLGLWLWIGGDAVHDSSGEDRTARSAQARLEEFRREHEQLRRDLESFRELTRQDSPYLYLGGDEQVDFVWGLDEPAASDVRPASASF